MHQNPLPLHGGATFGQWLVWPHAPGREATKPQGEPECRPDDQFVAMLKSFRLLGGLARIEEVLAMLGANCANGPNSADDTDAAARLATWIDEDRVFSLSWRAQLWLPLFQFSAVNRAPKTAVAPVLAELAGAFDSWDLADWFSQPHAALGSAAPASVIDTDLPAVLHAARADRYFALG